MSSLRFHKEGRAAVLSAYLDDSGTSGQEPVTLVAGFFADDAEWTRLDARWEAMLGEFDLARFHAGEFWARKSRPYAGWSNDKHKAAVSRIEEILGELDATGVATAVNGAAYTEWRHSLPHYVDPDPYHYCLDACLRAVADGDSGGGIAIYIDSDKKRERAGLQLAAWHEARPVNARPTSTHYVSSFDHNPLQVADTFANAFFQSCVVALETGMPGENPFLAAIRGGKSQPRQTFFHTKQSLEAAHRAQLAAFGWNEDRYAALVRIRGVHGTPAITDSKNVSSITDHARGLWSVNFTKPFSTSNYDVVPTGSNASRYKVTRSSGSVLIQYLDDEPDEMDFKFEERT